MQGEPKSIHHQGNAQSFYVKPSSWSPPSSPSPLPFTYHLSTLDVSQPPIVVGSIYVFQEDIPIQPLLSAVADALAQVPSLGGSCHIDFTSLDQEDGTTKKKVTGGKVVVSELSGIWVRSVNSSHETSSCSKVIEKGQQDEFLEIGERRKHPLPEDPLCWVQLTHLADGGCALGVAIHHFLCDAEGIIGFGRLISHFLESRLPPSPPPNHLPSEARFSNPIAPPPSSPLLPSLWCKWHKEEEQHQQLSKIVQEWRTQEAEPFFFDFPAQKLAHLKSKFLASLQASPNANVQPEGGYLTSNDVIVSIVWHCIAAARAACSSPMISQDCFQIVHYKQKMDPPIPASLFGNHILLARHSAPTPLPLFSSLDEETVWMVACSAAKVHNEVRHQVTEKAIENSLSVLQEVGASPLRSNIPRGDIVFSSWAKFDVKSVKMGGSSPISVLHRPVANWPGFVFFLPLMEGEKGSVRIFLRLHKTEMGHFRSLISGW